MATQNFFALLEDDENDDPSILASAVVAASTAFSAAKKQEEAPKIANKQPPHAQSVREVQDGGRGRGSFRRGRGGRGDYNLPRDVGESKPSFDGGREQSHGHGRGSGSGQGRKFSREEQLPSREYDHRSGPRYGKDREEHPRHRQFDRRSGSGYGNNGEELHPEPSEYNVKSGAGYGKDGQEDPGRLHFDRRSEFGYGNNGEEQPGRRQYNHRNGSGYGNGRIDQPIHHQYDHRSGSRYRSDIKDGTGTELDESSIHNNRVPTERNVLEEGKIIDSGKPKDEVNGELEDKKEAEEEDKEMTLEEYELILTEKRKALEALKSEERKVVLDKEFNSMQLVDKKIPDEVFLKLGSDKGKKKEVLDKEDKVRKSVSINEFLKPVNGEFYAQSRRRGEGDGRVRGGFRGRGDRGSFRGRGDRGIYGNAREVLAAPRIEDPGEFPTLGAK